MWLGRIMDRSEDQDSTDLQKCLECASEQIAASPSTLAGASIFAAGMPFKDLHLGFHLSTSTQKSVPWQAKVWYFDNISVNFVYM